MATMVIMVLWPMQVMGKDCNQEYPLLMVMNSFIKRMSLDNYFLVCSEILILFKALGSTLF